MPTSIDSEICRFFIVFLTSCKAYFNLDKTALEVHLNRYQGVACSLYLAHKLIYLSPVHKELPGSKGILVEYIPLLIRADMHTYDDNLTIFVYLHVGLLDADLAHSN